MLDKEWCYCGRPDCAGYAVAELNELHYETPGDTRRTWEKDLHRRLYTIPHAWRPGYHKRPHPAVKLPVQDEERNPTEMVTVQVAEQQLVNLIWQCLSASLSSVSLFCDPL